MDDTFPAVVEVAMKETEHGSDKSKHNRGRPRKTKEVEFNSQG